LTLTAPLTVRGVVVGEGLGTSISAARRAAATQALQYFHEHGIPVPEHGIPAHWIPEHGIPEHGIAK